ncbi:COP9 signalosome complex subunit 8 [Linepithema humile]|uniref:COP9 signalosome complex subunit 8 n=1 Tax=Linepithema humile TaxID=83485 RepID=UPI0006233D1E|nr:PREDICTED: LOW QUALITY PROTEIN: COP9 signalosome complex subunit 8 [Linepithema humile]
MVPSCTMELDKMMSELEMSELEAPNGIVSAEVYARLLAVYLHQNDLCQAKYLWKRIPADLKAENEELKRIWTVGQHMWQRNWPEMHAALNIEWTIDVRDIMAALKDKIRERIMRLISKAYSSLNLSAMATMTGMSLADARQAAIDKGWNVEDTLDAAIVLPWKKLEELEYNQTDKICLTEEQLQKLTQFVSFLEN